MKKKFVFAYFICLFFAFPAIASAEPITAAIVVAAVAKFAATVAISAALGAAIQYATYEKPDVASASDLESFTLPTTTQGRMKPVIFGSPRVTGYNDLWHGDLRSKAITTKIAKSGLFGNHKNEATGRYQYYLGFQYGFCNAADSILQIRMDEEILMGGETYADGTYNYSGKTWSSLYMQYFYEYESDDNYMEFSKSNDRWEMYSDYFGILFYNTGKTSTPPTSGWIATKSIYGSSPAVSVGATFTLPVTVTATDDTDINENFTLEVSKPKLFGGTDSSGGVSGEMDLMFGRSDQVANDYLVDVLEVDGDLVPAYKGMVCLVSRQMYIGTSNYLKQIDAIIRRTQTDSFGDEIWNVDQSEIEGSGGVKSMNAIHIIHELITDPEYSLTYSNAINYDSFLAAAQTCYDEGFALSLVWDTPSNGASIIDEIIGYIDGYFRVNPKTNEFEIKLLRDDYEIDDLDIITGDPIISIDGPAKMQSIELANTVTVTYTDPSTREDAYIYARNEALVSAHGETIKTMSAKYVHDADLANVIAINMLRRLSANPSTFTLTGFRELAEYNKGDVFRLQWEDEGFVDVVVRVLSADYGSLKDGTVSLVVEEDIYAVSDAVYATPPSSAWADNASSPTDLTYRSVIEEPYFVAVQDYGATAASERNTTTGRVFACGVANEGNSTTLDMIYRTGTAEYLYMADDFAFSPYFEIDTAMDDSIDEVTVSYSNGEDLSDLSITGFEWCAIGDEILKITEISTSDNEVTLARGCLDTLPQEHAIGDAVYVFGENGFIGSPEYATGETVEVKFIPSTTVGTLNEVNATSETLTMNSRYIRPYNGASFAGASNVNDVDFTWLHRNRLTQTNEITEQDETGITLESGTTYTFTAKDNGTTVKTVAGLTSEVYNYLEADLIADFGSIANAKLSTSTFHLKTIRDTYESWQEWDIIGTSIS